MNDSIQTYIDAYDHLRIEVAKFFYGGECNDFYVSKGNLPLEKLKIINKEYRDDRVIYTAKMFPGFKVGSYFYVVDEHGYRSHVKYRNIVRTKEFNDEYYYAGDDLGATYHEDHTVFKIWAPTASQVLLEVFDKVNRSEPDIYYMKRSEHGVYVSDIKGNLDGMSYVYIINRDNEVMVTSDPYAKSSGINQHGSIVINPKKTAVTKIPVEPVTTPIIYETSVRDFSSGLTDCARATFKGLVTEGLRTSKGEVAGFDYLKTLGITHLQLMSIYDFYTVDEENKFTIYNWGYDPSQYNVPEGSYASNPLDPYSRVVDLKRMVQKLHAEGIQVVMDVVYNHMYDRRKSAFEKTLPNYFFRINERGEVSNGSFCGNDFDSTMPMARKYILDSIKYWMEEYDIDGFRFDLMGILDVETMNLIEKLVHERKPHGLVYGEGWNMPTMLEDKQKAHMFNAVSMPNVGFFNDAFRDITKGKSGESEGYAKGYLTGDVGQIDNMKRVLCGNHYTTCFISPRQSINYVECHDNATAYDKIQMCCYGEGEENFRKRAKLLLAGVLLAQGIAFIHSGEEFCRTKGLRHNTYNAKDEINKLDYERKDEYLEVVEFTKKLIAIRKEYPLFSYRTYEDIAEHIAFESLPNGALKYSLEDGDYNLTICFNPTFGFIPLMEGEVVVSSEPIEKEMIAPLSVVVLTNK